jgi:putative tryptophan/tyrosine transport system substrate-binding protein
LGVTNGTILDPNVIFFFLPDVVLARGEAMRRRDFIALLNGVIGNWPLTARAQQAGKLPTIGVLGTNSTVWRPWTAAFSERLRELGWVDGQNIAIQYRWSEARPERVSEIAAEFVRLKTDVIVTVSGAIPIVRRQTTTIPIVFPISVDPIGMGLITNLSRPSGNVTGLSIESTDVAGKRLQYLREIVPHLRRLAIIFHGSYSAAVIENDAVQVAAHTLGLEVAPREIRRAEDIAPAFEAFKGQADALYVVEDSLISVNSERIVGLTLRDRLPTVFYAREVASAGGLLSYGPSYPALFRRAADFVDKILRGTKPDDIPVEQPTKFELVINLRTAKILGVTIPQTLLATADEVIE